MKLISPFHPGKPGSRLAAFTALLFDDYWLDATVDMVDPLFSVTRTKARVVSLRRHGDAVSIELAPNANWAGFVPGQFVPVRVPIRGVFQERCYSPTSDPNEKTLKFTVKRVPGGLVSNWLNENVTVGDIIELGSAAGTFVLPAALPEKLLFIAGGSGITAVASLLRGALKQRPEADVVLAFYAEDYPGFLLLDELRALQEEHPSLRIQLCVNSERTSTEDLSGWFTPEQLQGFCADFAERECFVCGPVGLMTAVSAHYAASGLEGRLHQEFYTPPPVQRTTEASTEVSFRRSGITVDTTEPTLLLAAEKAGLRPRSGCRMGICNTCSCTKVQGVTRDTVTGLIDNTPHSVIRTCVSEPLSAVILDL